MEQLLLLLIKSRSVVGFRRNAQPFRAKFASVACWMVFRRVTYISNSDYDARHYKILYETSTELCRRYSRPEVVVL